MATAPPKEKRNHMRVAVAVAVLCEPMHGEPFAGVTTDVGLGGAHIESSHVPAFGATLVVAMRLPGSPDLSRLPAMVRWVGDGAFGVQFGLLGARDTRHIAELMARALRS